MKKTQATASAALHVVLVRSEYATNVGAAARALANMGGSRLILIDRQCEIDESAHQAAAGAQTPLRSRTEYSSWQEFYRHEGDGLRIGLTRRAGKNRKLLALPDYLKSLKRGRRAWLKGPVYLVFGPEADGLNAQDLAFVHQSCHLPVFGDFASLNLAQAVLLALYIFRQSQPPAKRVRQTLGEADPSVQPFYFPDDMIKRWLTAMGFDINARRSSAYLTLRKLFLQNLPTRHELQVLEAVLQQNIRKLEARRK